MKQSNESDRTRTKIITTIGPASRNYETISAMINEGMDVARMNFSHSTHQDHQNTVDHIRKLNEENKSNTCLLGDLQGPKLRVGLVMNNEIFLESGKNILLTPEETISTPEKLYIKYEQLAKDVKPGERSYLMTESFRWRLSVPIKRICWRRVLFTEVSCHPKKASTFHRANSPVPAISAKDKSDLDFALKNEVEWIALSFVRNAEDIVELKSLLKEAHSHARVIAKIEKPEAVQNIEEIIAATDGVMVARGDLGVEMELEKVPILQKQIVKACVQAAKPVIIATQMMESMIVNPDAYSG
jgi:pyruvate kinase